MSRGHGPTDGYGGSGRSGARRAAVTLLLLGASILVALWVLAPTFHWALRIDLLDHLLPSLLWPRTGMLSLIGALFLLTGGSYLLITAPIARAPGQDPQGAAALAEELAHGTKGPALRIPIGPVTALDARARRQAAKALEIGWDDAWASDDERWQRAYEDGMGEALEILRRGTRA
ncbi:hypothetical protein ACXET9_02325 [Brachybacterium sp. DNPG3]